MVSIEPPLGYIGISINVSVDRGLAPGFAQLPSLLEGLAEAGYSHVEIGARGLGLIIGGQVQPSRLARLTESLEGSALRRTLHSSWSPSGRVGNLLDVASARMQRLGLLADLEIARTIGASVLVYHSGSVANLHADAETLAAAMEAERTTLRELGDRAGEHGVLIAVENRTPSSYILGQRSYGMSLDLLHEQVQRVDHPNVAICLDIGHAYLGARYLGYDFLSAVTRIAPAVGHIHLSDNFGRIPQPGAEAYEMEFLGEGDLHLPPGWGTIPLNDVFAIPFPRDPIVMVEMRHFEHYAEALERTRDLLRAGVRIRA